MDGILASIFLGFWSILGGKLGGKPEPRSTQKGIEKIVEKRKSTRRPKNRPQDGQQGLRPPLTRDILDPNRRWGVSPFKAGQTTRVCRMAPLASKVL